MSPSCLGVDVLVRNKPAQGFGVSDGEQQLTRPLGRTEEEDEAEHLRRMADELGGANSTSLAALRTSLAEGDIKEKRAAAASLGTLGDRNAIALLRGLLEGENPHNWELAVHGLRQSKDRAGWLCLESVALDLLPALEHESQWSEHAFRLLVMGRTKTMDRLFRAIDGHSRAISATAAINFSNVAVSSVPSDLSVVMGMRLGLHNGAVVNPSSPEQISQSTGLTLETVRRVEAEAWEAVQRPRRYREIRRNYEVNNDRLRAAD